MLRITMQISKVRHFRHQKMLSVKLWFCDVSWGHAQCKTFDIYLMVAENLQTNPNRKIDFTLTGSGTRYERSILSLSPYPQQLCII